MEFKVTRDALHDLETPLLAVPVFADDGARGRAFAVADTAASGRLTAIADEEGFKGESGRTLLVHTSDEKAKRILLVGCGKAADLTEPGVRSLTATAVREANARRLSRCAVALPEGPSVRGAVRFGVEGAILGAYRFDQYRTRDVEPRTCEVVTLAVSGAANGLDDLVRRARIAAEAVCFARDLVNGPACDVTPTRLANEAEKIAREGGLEVQVFDQEEIARRGMNLLLAVSAGSAQPPRFIHLTYKPKGANGRTPSIAFIGKGITFDSGGYSIKPAKSMEDMKMDMAGAAAVLGAMKATAELEPGYVVHGIVPTCENMVSGNATRVADIIRSMNGKTVEIMNTDAEGRLVLADALTYAERLGVSRVVDLATLTGACMVALGPNIAGLFAGDQAFGEKVRSAANACGEEVWPMPLSKRLKGQIKSPNADLKNVGSRWGGAITAGLFLQEFAGDVPWVHLDIAGPAFLEKGDSINQKGATGFGVLTLLELLQGEV